MIEGQIRNTGLGTSAPGADERALKKPRDLRLDFFRGLAMFIILLAHTRGNTWTLWIPARFGFSDATEIFVFCSGFASALAFGAVFAKKSWRLGTARIAFRIWQVYWAHIGILLVTALILFTIDHYELGEEGRRYIAQPYLVPIFTRTGETLLGIFTLRYVPGLFDILPMYLVILALVPVVMALYRYGGRAAVGVFVVGLWLAASLAGYSRTVGRLEDPSEMQLLIASLGNGLQWMNFAGTPWGTSTWFFNPFGWQLVFFAGFAFGMRWLPAPPVNRRLIWLAVAFLLISLPFAWFKLHRGVYIPADWALTEWIKDTRDWIQPLWWKTWQGLFRFMHFLSIAYLAWVAVGEGGRRLSEGFNPPRAIRGIWLAVAGGVLVLTAPYAYVDEIKSLAPALDAWLLTWVPVIDSDMIGLVQIAHLIALILLVWSAMGETLRRKATGPWFLAVVPIIRKVGTQSLAVFMVSIPLAVTNGWLLDLLDRDVWTRAGVNLFGFGVLITTAYLVSWFKSQPWRGKPASASAPATAESRTMPGQGGDALRV